MTPPPPTAPPSEPATVPGGGPGTPDRARLVGGIALIALGIVFLLARFVRVELGIPTWPLFVIVPGLALLVAGFATGARNGLGLVIPGAVVTTVGLILWVQAATGGYATWAYAWALVAPSSIGLAMAVYGRVIGDRAMSNEGLRTLGVGITLFAGFGIFFEGVIGLSGRPWVGLDAILPVVAIALGVVLVLVSLVRRPARHPSDRPRA